MIYNAQGISAIVDGQFGSTGKGLLASYIAEHLAHGIDGVITNAGPNSGHTFYVGSEKVVLKQLPTIAVYAKKRFNLDIPVFISAGAVVNPEILNKEARDHNVKVILNPQAALIRPEYIEAEQGGSIFEVAGTRQGVGHAIAQKVMRNPLAVVGSWNDWHENIELSDDTINWSNKKLWTEISQGFSLGLNSHFYPKVTSRECTVAQALADCRAHPSLLKQTAMVVRTYPIRVGNADGYSSGDKYWDQDETTWAELGLPPEMTTVTGRVRRVFTFSTRQIQEAITANKPDHILINFMNHLKDRDERVKIMRKVAIANTDVWGTYPHMLFGYGPKVTDISEDIL